MLEPGLGAIVQFKRPGMVSERRKLCAAASSALSVSCRRFAQIGGFPASFVRKLISRAIASPRQCCARFGLCGRLRFDLDELFIGTACGVIHLHRIARSEPGIVRERKAGSRHHEPSLIGFDGTGRCSEATERVATQILGLGKRRRIADGTRAIASSTVVSGRVYPGCRPDRRSCAGVRLSVMRAGASREGPPRRRGLARPAVLQTFW